MIEGIKACCAIDGRYNEPFRFEMNGAPWVGATNGHVMAAIETSDAETLAAATGASPGDKGIAGALAVTDEGWQLVPFSALRAWCHEGPHTAPCDHCNGTRRLTCEQCDGKGRQKHDCDCSYCHVVDDGPCEECDGVGSYDCEECEKGMQETALPGVIAGIVVNRVLLAKALASAPPVDTVALRVNIGVGDMLQLSAPWWRAALMAWREDKEGLSVFCGPVADDSPRDKIVSPRMGDWFFDAHGWVRRVDYAQPGAVTYTAYCSIGDGKAEHAVSSKWPWLCAEYGLRPMTPGEVEAFERDGTRPEATP